MARTAAEPPVRGHRYIPTGFHYTIVIAAFFILRELELSTMVRGSVTMNALLMTVTILLPVSKTDVMALSCQRTWGCVCGETVDPYSCPYHAMEAQLQLLSDIFGEKGSQDCDRGYQPNVPIR